MKRKKLFVFAFTLAAVLTSYSVAFAGTDAGSTSSHAAPAAFHDVSNHWAKDAIYKWTDRGIVNGYAGSFRPNDSITRGEMAVILDNMMDYQVIADNTFTDLKAGKFYAEPILKANAAGIIQGNGSSVRPMDKITREEAAVILARAFAVDTSTGGSVSFNDASAISSWAKDYVGAIEAEGYVKGANHKFLPKNRITRAEIVTMIDNIVKAYYTEAGTYTEDAAGTAVVRASGVVLKGMRISEDLIIAEGVGEGNVTLDSVTVNGDAVIRGGGKNSVHIIGTSNITSVRLEKVDGAIRLVVADGSTVRETTVAAGEKIIIAGTVGTLEIAASDVVVNIEDAKIGNTNISGDKVTVEGNGNITAGSGGSHRGSNSTPVISAVSIGGKTAVGSTLTANPTPSYATGTYQWQRADTIDGSYINIGTDSKTYALTADDEGKYIKVGITGTGIYTGVQTSTGIGPVSAQPVMTGTVAIDGTAKYNETLTANITGLIYTPNTNDNVPSYQWKRNGTVISGTSGAEYQLVEEDMGKRISVTVAADGVNATGASITSAETQAIVKADGPSAPSAPTLASKSHNTVILTPIPGAEYRINGGPWQSSPVFTGLTAETAYSFTARIKESGTHLPSAASSATEIETSVFPVMSGTVTIDGVVKYNETLTAIAELTYTPTTNSNVPAYQWKRNGAAISGATGSAYTLAEADVGTKITVTVTADGVNATGADITSAETAAVVKADGPGIPSAPTLTSKSHNTVTLAAITGAEYRMDSGPWQSSPVFTGLTAETSYSFTARIKESITHYASAESSSTEIKTGVFPVMSGAVSIDGVTKYNETLTANITGIVYTPNTNSNVPSYQWKRNGSAISGATGKTYTLVVDDIGKAISVTVVSDGVNATGAGITSTETAIIGKADRPAPTAPTLASKTHNTITLTAKALAEYRVNGGPWQSSTVFTGLTAETAYSFTARYKETADYFASAASSATIIETEVFPVMSGTVSIDGIARYDATLTANITGIVYTPNTNSNVLSYQWKRGGTAINGATGKTYVLAADDIGKAITVTVSADGVNATGAGITSTATAVVEKAYHTTPSAPTIASRTDNTITLAAIAGAEYRMDSGAWQTSPVFTGLTARTLHTFTVRLGETATYFASDESDLKSATTTTNSEVLSVLGVDSKMLYVPGGTYPATTGSPSVLPYWMSETEVTYELWYAVRTWAEEHGYVFWLKGLEGSVTGGGSYEGEYVNMGTPPTSASDEPVTCITTCDMMVWLNALSELTERSPLYYSTIGDCGVLKNAQGAFTAQGLKVERKNGNNGYRLPDRNQWEFAARWKCADPSGGFNWNPGSYASGATENSRSAAGAVAWFADNTQKTQPVARKEANGLGFYDMSGNVWEVINDYSCKTTFSGGSIYWSDTSVLAGGYNGKFNPDPDYYYDTNGVTIDGTDKGFRFVRP